MRWWPLLALLISPLVSALTLDDLQQRFTEQPVIRAHFDQTRTIKDLPQPLRSQGQMLIARDQGLLWDQTAPFPMQLLLDDKRMVQAIGGPAAADDHRREQPADVPVQPSAARAVSGRPSGAGAELPR